MASLPSPLSDLPPDLFANVAQHMSWRDTGNLMLSSRALQAAVLHSNELWAFHLSTRFSRCRGLSRASFLRNYIDLHDKSFQFRMRDLTREWTQLLGGYSHFIVVSPNRKRVLAAHQMKPFCFGMEGPSESWGLHGHTGRITCAKFMGNDHVLTASADKTVRLWSLGVRRMGRHMVLKPVRTFKGHTESVTCLEILDQHEGDGEVVASGSADGTVRLWSACPMPRRPPLQSILRGHGAEVTSLMAGSREGLLSGSMDSKVKCWDAETSVCRHTWRVSDPCKSLLRADTRDPNVILGMTRTHANVIDVRSPRVAALPAVLKGEGSILCSASHDMLLTVGTASGAIVADIRAWHSGADSLQRVAQLTSHAGPVTSVSMDRHKIVTGTNMSGEGPVRVWSADGEELRVLPSELDGGKGSARGALPHIESEEDLIVPRGSCGVSALCASGPVLATCSTGGKLVYRDFTSGLPDSDATGDERRQGSKFWALRAED